VKHLAPLLFLTACASPAPLLPIVAPITIQRVEIPVPVSCVPVLSPTPDVPSRDAIRAAPGHFERTKLVVQAYILLSARNGELEAALEACK
jgi:hypothetical protein